MKTVAINVFGSTYFHYKLLSLGSSQRAILTLRNMLESINALSFDDAIRQQRP